MDKDTKILTFPQKMKELAVAITAIATDNTQAGVIVSTVGGLESYLSTRDDVVVPDCENKLPKLQNIIDANRDIRFVLFRALSKINKGYTVVFKKTTSDELLQLFKLLDGFETGFEILK